MRGKPQNRWRVIFRKRITPAGAGKTDPPPPKPPPKPGSPPQVRGKLVCRDALQLHTRITPAGAGKTSCRPRLILRDRDHPRRCGENHHTLTQESIRLGSPPQVRGKRVLSTITQNRGRITPAGAGKTKQIFVNKFSAEDHPRRCGENQDRATVNKAIKGSPPQVRGKHHFRRSSESAAEDHPRRCGENPTASRATRRR